MPRINKEVIKRDIYFENKSFEFDSNPGATLYAFFKQGHCCYSFYKNDVLEISESLNEIKQFTYILTGGHYRIDILIYSPSELNISVVDFIED